MNNALKKYLILAIAAGGIIVWLISKRSTSFELGSKDFRFPKTEFNKITLQNSDGKTTLSKKNGTWYLPENKETSPSAVQLLLSSLYRLEAVAPAGKIQLPRLNHLKESTATEVQIFMNEKTVKMYCMVFDSLNRSNYIYLSDNRYPFSARIEGFSGDNFLPVFQTDIEYWLPHQVFNISVNALQSIEVKYPSGEKQGFRLIRENNEFRLSGENLKDKTLQDKTASYLSFLGVLRYSREITEPVIIHDVTSRAPFAALTVEYRNGYRFETSFFKIGKTDGSIDFNKLYALKEKRLYLIKYLDIDPVLQESDYFMKK